MTNWAEVNESLQQRGDLTIWITDEALGQCSAPRRTIRGGKPRYSDMAITIFLLLGVVYKLHLGLDLAAGELICANLTLDNISDPTALPELLDQFNEPVTRFLADGAYDGASTSHLLKMRFGEAVEIIIPPPKNAVPSPLLARGEHLFGVTKTDVEPGVEPDRMEDDVGRKAVTLERELIRRPSLRPDPPHGHPSLCDSAQWSPIAGITPPYLSRRGLARLLSCEGAALGGI